MTFWECFLALLPFIAALWGVFGIVYPVVMVILYKLAGSGLTVKEILRRI